MRQASLLERYYSISWNEDLWATDEPAITITWKVEDHQETI